MNIWLIKAGEPLPIDGKDVRLFRTGIFANFLSENEHNVTWWSAIFDHQNKRHRSSTEAPIQLKKNLRLITLRSDGYEKNISLKRIKDHRQLAKNFAILAKREQKPDVILSAFPTIELCVEAIQFAKENEIPIYIDIRDLWPDIYVDHIFPKVLAPLGKFLITPFKRSVRKIMNGATGLVSISLPMLNWGLNYANRNPQSTDNVFPFGYTPTTLTNQEICKAEAYFRSLGVLKEGIMLRACLFATLNNSFNIETLINAAKLLINENLTIQFVICGSGEQLDRYKKEAEGLSNFHFAGWVDFPTIKYLMKISDIGLAPYINTPDFAASIPNKAIEYLSGGLPILTSIQGHLTDILEENTCGWSYENNKPEKLAKILIDIASNQTDLNKKKINAKKLFVDNFIADEVYNSFMKHITQNITII